MLAFALAFGVLYGVEFKAHAALTKTNAPFTYTGDWDITEYETGKFYARFLSSGDFTPKNAMTIDVFLVGGGGGGGRHTRTGTFRGTLDGSVFASTFNMKAFPNMASGALLTATVPHKARTSQGCSIKGAGTDYKLTAIKNSRIPDFERQV